MFSAEQLENIKTRKELVALSKIEGINLKKSIKRAKYEEELKLLQTELSLVQEHIEKKNLRVAVIFQGRDAARKGDSIKRFV